MIQEDTIKEATMDTYVVRDMHVYSEIRLSDIGITYPCVYCHIDSMSSISAEALIRKCSRVSCTAIFDGSEPTEAELRVCCMGEDPDSDDPEAMLRLLHVFANLCATFTHEFLTTLHERMAWYLFVLCDDDERVICFKVSRHGTILERQFADRDQFDFIRSSPLQLQ